MNRHGWLVSLGSLLGIVGAVLGQPAVAPYPPVPPAGTLPPAPLVMSGPAESSGGFLDSGPSPPRIWITPEYLLWWIRPGPLSSPLVTSTTLPGVTNSAGVDVGAGLGQPGTVILVGDQGINYGALSGFRLSAGYSLNDSATLSVMGRGFWLGEANYHRTFASDANGNPIIGIPIFDATGTFGGGENAITVSNPGTATIPAIYTGFQTVQSRSQMGGAEGNALVCLFRSQGMQVNGLVGYRYLDLREDLSLTAVSSSVTPAATFGGVAFMGPHFYDGTVASVDTFRTRNQFYGGQLGLDGTSWFGNAFIYVAGRLGLGTMHQVLDVSGLSSLVSTTLVASAPGGTLALPSNIGRFRHEAFAVVPELECKFGYAILPNLEAFVGYNLLYISNVVRPGYQIDRNVDVRMIPTLPSFIPGFPGAEPAHVFRQSDFWAQGLTFGLSLAF